jgi:hypothetical protein
MYDGLEDLLTRPTNTPWERGKAHSSEAQKILRNSYTPMKDQTQKFLEILGALIKGYGL